MPFGLFHFFARDLPLWLKAHNFETKADTVLILLRRVFFTERDGT